MVKRQIKTFATTRNGPDKHCVEVFTVIKASVNQNLLNVVTNWANCITYPFLLQHCSWGVSSVPSVPTFLTKIVGHLFKLLYLGHAHHHSELATHN